MKLISLLMVLILTFATSCVCSRTYSFTGRGEITARPDLETLLQVSVQLAQEDSTKICSGTIISGSNPYYILTACHCILHDDATPMEYGFIFTPDKYRVEVLGYDRANDLALLETTDKLPPMPIAQISWIYPSVGDAVWTIGAPNGIADTVSRGIVSKIPTPCWGGQDCFATDAAVYYGNSGGGVFDTDGQLVGVVVEFGPQGGQDVGWGHAVELKTINLFLNKTIP